MERGFAQGRRFHAISSEQDTLASCWRSIWPAFLALPDHSSAQGKAHGVLAVNAACAGKPAAPTQRSPEPTAARASEPLAMLRSERNPAVAHTFIARPRSSAAISSPAYHRLGDLFKCPRSRSVSLCCFCHDLSDRDRYLWALQASERFGVIFVYRNKTSLALTVMSRFGRIWC